MLYALLHRKTCSICVRFTLIRQKRAVGRFPRFNTNAFIMFPAQIPHNTSINLAHMYLKVYNPSERAWTFGARSRLCRPTLELACGVNSYPTWIYPRFTSHAQLRSHGLSGTRVNFRRSRPIFHQSSDANY